MPGKQATSKPDSVLRTQLYEAARSQRRRPLAGPAGKNGPLRRAEVNHRTGGALSCFFYLMPVVGPRSFNCDDRDTMGS
eukprot:341213-Rhodomonas_salina.1